MRWYRTERKPVNTFLHVPSGQKQKRSALSTTLKIAQPQPCLPVFGTTFLLTWLPVPNLWHLAEVAAGSMPVNYQVVNHLQDALNSLPNSTGDGLKKSFASSILLGRWKKKGRQMRRRTGKGKGRKQVNQTQSGLLSFFLISFYLCIWASIYDYVSPNRWDFWDGGDYCLPAI